MPSIESLHEIQRDAAVADGLAPRSERLVMTSVRLDRNLHQALRQIAFDRRKSLHSLLIEGARTICQRYQQETERETPER